MSWNHFISGCSSASSNTISKEKFPSSIKKDLDPYDGIWKVRNITSCESEDGCLPSYTISVLRSEFKVDGAKFVYRLQYLNGDPMLPCFHWENFDPDSAATIQIGNVENTKSGKNSKIFWTTTNPDSFNIVWEYVRPQTDEAYNS